MFSKFHFYLYAQNINFELIFVSTFVALKLPVYFDYDEFVDSFIMSNVRYDIQKKGVI